jgi:hypothetical protein
MESSNHLGETVQEITFADAFASKAVEFAEKRLRK